MRFFVLDNLNASDPLAQLFNAYIDRLRPLDAIALPRETMRELRELEDLVLAPHGLEQEQVHQYFFRQAQYYTLSVLCNALHGFHAAVTSVVQILDSFSAAFHGDLHAYAVERRYQFLQQFGSEHDEDYDAGGQLLRKEDEEALRQWGLWDKLSEYFYEAGECSRRREQIGSSSAEDFAELTRLVGQATDFSPVKFFQAKGHEIPTARIGEDGQLHALNLSDRVETELNQALRNGQLAQRFGNVWTRGQELAEFFRTMSRHDPAAFTQLLSDTKHLLTS